MVVGQRGDQGKADAKHGQDHRGLVPQGTPHQLPARGALLRDALDNSRQEPCRESRDVPEGLRVPGQGVPPGFASRKRCLAVSRAGQGSRHGPIEEPWTDGGGTKVIRLARGVPVLQGIGTGISRWTWSDGQAASPRSGRVHAWLRTPCPLSALYGTAPSGGIERVGRVRKAPLVRQTGGAGQAGD
jgi:hypothetical protein